MTDAPIIPPYAIGGKVFFWLLWLLGLLVCLLFSLFAFIMLVSKGWLLAVWNLLVAVAESYLLVQSKRAMSRHEKTMSELLWLAALAGIGVPLVAVGGCGMLSSLMPRMAG